MPVQALETFGKLGDVAGNVRMTLDKLEGIRADLKRTSTNWKKRTFPDLKEALRDWTERNPLQQGENESRRDRSLATGGQTRQCVYCESKEYRSLECDKVVSPSD